MKSPEALETGLSLTPPFPERVVIELTNRCNLLCEMCPRHHMNAKLGDMSTALFHKIIDEVSEYTATSIAPFFRGETLLHPHVLDLLQYARKKISARIMLFTNAMVLNRILADSLLDIGIDHISFSVDSPDAETYEKIRIGGDFKIVTENVAYFLEQKARRGLRLPETQVSMVRTSLNTHAVDRFMEIWNGKVDRIRIYEEHSRNGSFGSSNVQDEASPRYACFKPFNEMAIYWDGAISLCNHDWDRKKSPGNAFHDSLTSIWNSSAYREIRKKHLSGGWESLETCSACDQWKAYYNKTGVVGKIITDL